MQHTKSNQTRPPSPSFFDSLFSIAQMQQESLSLPRNSLRFIEEIKIPRSLFEHFALRITQALVAARRHTHTPGRQLATASDANCHGYTNGTPRTACTLMHVHLSWPRRSASNCSRLLKLPTVSSNPCRHPLPPPSHPSRSIIIIHLLIQQDKLPFLGATLHPPPPFSRQVFWPRASETLSLTPLLNPSVEDETRFL